MSWEVHCETGISGTECHSCGLAITVDKMGKHDEATAAFKQAVALAPANPAIKDSPILKKHLGA